MCPQAAVALRARFDESNPAWSTLASRCYTPLPLNRAVSNATSVLVSGTALDAAEDVRDYPVYVLDRKTITPSFDAYYVFVKDGDAPGTEAETRNLVTLPTRSPNARSPNAPVLGAEEAGHIPADGEVIKLHGHFGWVPVDGILSWKTRTASLISATFTGVCTSEGLPLRSMAFPSLAFRPLPFACYPAFCFLVMSRCPSV